MNYINNHPNILKDTDHEYFDTSAALLSDNTDLKILLVDDNPRFRYHLKRIINNTNNEIQIFEADTLDKAINIAKAANLSLIFMDVILGDENGILGVKKIKK